MLGKLSKHGRVLLVVDQPNTIGSLPLTVARNMGIAVAYLPGTAMRRTAQLLPGDAKTDLVQDAHGHRVGRAQAARDAQGRGPG